MLSLAFVLKNWRLLACAGAAIAIIGWGAYERHEFLVEGADKALQKVEQANESERNRADAAADEVALCSRSGGTWDRDRGLCDRPAGR